MAGGQSRHTRLAAMRAKECTAAKHHCEKWRRLWRRQLGGCGRKVAVHGPLLLRAGGQGHRQDGRWCEPRIARLRSTAARSGGGGCGDDRSEAAAGKRRSTGRCRWLAASASTAVEGREQREDCSTKTSAQLQAASASAAAAARMLRSGDGGPRATAMAGWRPALRSAQIVEKPAETPRRRHRCEKPAEKPAQCCTRRWQQPGGCERKQQPWADASAGGMPADADDSAQDAAAAAAAAARRLRPAAAGHGPLILLAGGQRFDRVKGGDASQESFGGGFNAAARGGGSSSEAASYRLFGGCELQTARRLRAADCSAEDSAQVQAAAAAARRLRPAAAGHGPLILLAGGQRFDRVKGGDASQESFGSGFSAAARGGGSSSEAASYRQPGGCELQTVRLRIRRRCKRRRRQLGGCDLQRRAMGH